MSRSPHMYSRRASPAPVRDGPMAMVDTSQLNRLKSGKMHGLWINYDHKGTLEQCGNYILGVKTGAWNTYDSDGSPNSTGMYENGKRTGPWMLFYKSGVTNAVGMMKDDEKVGTWTVYNEDGTFKKTVNF